MASHGTCMGTDGLVDQMRFPMRWVIGLCTRSGSRRPIGSASVVELPGCGLSVELQIVVLPPFALPMT